MDAQGGHKNISKYKKWALENGLGLAPQKINRGKGNSYEGRCHLPIIARRSGAVRVRDDVVTLTDVNAILLGPIGRQVLYYMTGTWSLPSLRREREAEHPL